MKKVLLSALVLVMCLTLAFGLVGCANSDEVDSNSSQAATSIRDSSSSDKSDVVTPNVVELLPATAVVKSNVGALTVAEINDVSEEGKSLELLHSILDGITIGSIAKEIIGQTIIFDYFDDGNWYLGNGQKFTKVPNIIFNYELSSGNPLVFPEDVLMVDGNKSVLSCFTMLFFNMPAEKVLGPILNAASENAEDESNLAKIASPLISMTVKDLNDMMLGESYYLTEEYGNIPAKVIIGLFDDYVKITDPTILSIVNVIKNLIGDKTIAQTIQALSECDLATAEAAIGAELAKIQLYDFIDNCSETVSSFLTESDLLLEATAEYLTQYIADIVKQIYKGGTLAAPELNLEADYTEILTEVLIDVLSIKEDEVDKAEFASAVSTVIISLIQGDFETITDVYTDYSEKKIVEIDGYVNNYISIILTSLDPEFHMNNDATLGKYVNDITRVVELVKGLVNQFIASEDKVKFIGDFCAENIRPTFRHSADVTLAEINEHNFDGALTDIIPAEFMSMTVEQILDLISDTYNENAPQIYENILHFIECPDDFIQLLAEYASSIYASVCTVKVSEFDEKFFNDSIVTAFEPLIEGVGDYTFGDFFSLLSAPNAELKAKIDVLTVNDIIKAISEIDFSNIACKGIANVDENQIAQ